MQIKAEKLLDQSRTDLVINFKTAALKYILLMTVNDGARGLPGL